MIIKQCCYLNFIVPAKIRSSLILFKEMICLFSSIVLYLEYSRIKFINAIVADVGDDGIKAMSADVAVGLHSPN